MALALHHERPRMPGMFLQPFGSGAAHIVQLGPIAIRQISHLSILEAPPAGSMQADP
jgi:hypothetical protein